MTDMKAVKVRPGMNEFINHNGFSNYVTYVALKVAVSFNFKILPSVFLKLGKKNKACEPKQILQYLIRKNTTYSFAEIGFLTGGYTHATVMSNIKLIKGFVSLYSEYREKIEDIESIFNQEINYIK